MAYIYNIIINDEDLCDLIKEEKIEMEYEWELNDVTRYLAFNKHLNELKMEVGYIAAFRDDRFLGLYQCGKGDDSSAPRPPREMFTFLLLVGADQFVTYHNHPNNALEASTNDMLCALDNKEVACKLHLDYKDDIIIGKSGIYSQDAKDRFCWEELDGDCF